MDGVMVDRYGPGKVRKVVVDFYRRVLTSIRLSRHFDRVDIQALVSHQAAFLAAVMGGPQSHDPNEIRESHASLGITSADFAEMIELLGESLDRFAFDPEDRRTVLDTYRGYADQVITAAD